MKAVIAHIENALDELQGAMGEWIGTDETYLPIHLVPISRAMDLLDEALDAIQNPQSEIQQAVQS